MTHDELTRSLTVERRAPIPTHTPQDQQTADLRRIIHLLATAMGEGMRTA